MNFFHGELWTLAAAEEGTWSPVINDWVLLSMATLSSPHGNVPCSLIMQYSKDEEDIETTLCILGGKSENYAMTHALTIFLLPGRRYKFTVSGAVSGHSNRIDLTGNVISLQREISTGPSPRGRPTVGSGDAKPKEKKNAPVSVAAPRKRNHAKVDDAEASNEESSKGNKRRKDAPSETNSPRVLFTDTKIGAGMELTAAIIASHPTIKASIDPRNISNIRLSSEETVKECLGDWKGWTDGLLGMKMGGRRQIYLYDHVVKQYEGNLSFSKPHIRDLDTVVLVVSLLGFELQSGEEVH